MANCRSPIVGRLLREIPTIAGVTDELVDRARVLDPFYVLSQYPYAHPESAPFEHYGALQSNEAVDHASKIIEFVRDEMAQRGDGA